LAYEKVFRTVTVPVYSVDIAIAFILHISNMQTASTN